MLPINQYRTILTGAPLSSPHKTTLPPIKHHTLNSKPPPWQAHYAHLQEQGSQRPLGKEHNVPKQVLQPLPAH